MQNVGRLNSCNNPLFLSDENLCLQNLNSQGSNKCNANNFDSSLSF